MRNFILIIPFALSLLLSPARIQAAGSQEEFNAGRMIVDHIIDAHEWHILSIGETHVSIPLPVILIHKGNLTAFSFARFHHGKEAYKGYRYMTEGPHKGKIIYEGEGVTLSKPELPLDFSITKNVLSIFISVLMLSLIFISVARSYQRNRGHAPHGVQSFLEPLILFIRNDVAKASIGEKHYERFLPYLLTVFFFIFLSNLLGLVPIFPGGANVTGNISVTLVLAVFTFLITNLSGNRNYWKHIFNAPGVPVWLKIPIPLMPVLELLGAITKPFVLTVRLFANITAGHIIILGFMSLIFIFGNISPYLGFGLSWVSVLFAIFMGLLEILVAFLQAFVFTLLSALYFGMATEEHHEHSTH